MAWTKTSQGKNSEYLVATETVSLGTALNNRYTSEIDFIPVGSDFVVISNTAATNTSASASDQLYCAYESGGTYYSVKDTLRDCNYADDTNQGTSFRDLDTASRRRYVDVSYVGDAPYWKIRVLQAGAEVAASTITFAIIVGKNNVKSRVQD